MISTDGNTAWSDPSALHHVLPHWKRALDLLVAVSALPLLTALALAMWLATGGRQVFYRQERIGLLGRRFVLYKFRTMQVHAECGTHRAHLEQLMRTNAPMQKLDAKNDPRLIRGGWLLRASGLDELPQIINVLRGEMSIVGPRPCLLYEYEAYSPVERERFLSLPGVTGLWQVSGKNHTTFREMIRLDLQYNTEKSLWLDLKIILLTIPTIISQVGETHRMRHARASCSTQLSAGSKHQHSPANAQPLRDGSSLMGRLVENQNSSNP